VDLSALQFTDSSGVGLMLRLKKQIEGRGGRLRFIVPAGIGQVCLRDDVTEAQVREAWERSTTP